MTFEEIVERLQTPKIMPKVNRVSGIHYNQIWRIKKGYDVNPQTKTVIALSNALDEIEATENGANNTPAK